MVYGVRFVNNMQSPCAHVVELMKERGRGQGFPQWGGGGGGGRGEASPLRIYL